MDYRLDLTIAEIDTALNALRQYDPGDYPWKREAVRRVSVKLAVHRVVICASDPNGAVASDIRNAYTLLTGEE